MKFPRSDGAVLHRVADENQLQVIFLGDAEQLDGLLVPQDRGFIDDDAAAAGGCLHLFVEQEAGDRLRILEAVLLQHLDRGGGRAQIGDWLPGQPRPFVEFLQQLRFAGPGRAQRAVDAVRRCEQARGRVPLPVGRASRRWPAVRVSPSATPIGATVPRPSRA